MKEIKILQVIDSYYPVIEGVVNVLDNYTTILNTIEGVECHALVPMYKPVVERGYKTLRCKSMRVKKFGLNLPLPSFDCKLKKALEQTHYDLIHLHAPVTIGRYIAKYARKHNIPTVFTSHTRYHEEINRSVKCKTLQKMALNYCINTMKMVDNVWAPSEANGIEVEQMYNLGRSCYVQRNGTDIVDNCPQEIFEKVKQETLEKYDIDTERDNVLLFVGRIVPIKNLDIVIDAMVKLKETSPTTKLLIVGDGDYKQHLEDRCRELNLNDNVKFTGAIRDRNIITAYYKLAHLFVFPSTFDTGSLTIREAAALGLPVIVVDNCSSSEEIVDNHNSYLAKNNGDAWADKIADIFSDKARHATVRANFYNELYRSWEMVVHKVLDKYREIIEEHNKK